jgi:hypothetical protein
MAFIGHMLGNDLEEINEILRFCRGVSLAFEPHRRELPQHLHDTGSPIPGTAALAARGVLSTPVGAA